MPHGGPAGLAIGQVEGQQARPTLTTGGDQFDSSGHGGQQGLAQLTRGAGEENFHSWDRGNPGKSVYGWQPSGAASSCR